MGGDDSSSGSDSAPSEDNLQAEDLIKQLPVVDKTLKLQLKKNQEKRNYNSELLESTFCSKPKKESRYLKVCVLPASLRDK